MLNIYFGEILYTSYLISYLNRDVSFVIICRKQCEIERCIGCSSWLGILRAVLFIH